MLQDVRAASKLAFSDAATPRLVCEWRADRLGAAWIDVNGGVDEVSAPLLVRALDQARAAACLVMLDLRSAALLDRSGGHAIREAASLAHQQGHQVVVVQRPDQPDVSLALASAPEVRACFLDPGQPSIQALLQLARAPLPRRAARPSAAPAVSAA
jgi:anti-anti-sigma regulatory factor